MPFIRNVTIGVLQFVCVRLVIAFVIVGSQILGVYGDVSIISSPQMSDL